MLQGILDFWVQEIKAEITRNSTLVVLMDQPYQWAAPGGSYRYGVRLYIYQCRKEVLHIDIEKRSDDFSVSFSGKLPHFFLTSELEVCIQKMLDQVEQSLGAIND